jgi:lipoate-protein ligase A
LSNDRFSWRLLVHAASDGAWNMAVDEAVLEGYLEPDAQTRPPTLRLYGWNPPALSLGKSQPSSASFEPRVLQRRRIDLVRRPTGGLAVLHDRERTYAVAGALRCEPFTGGVLETYRSISAALEDAMRSLGAAASASSAPPEGTPLSQGPSCFALTSSHEITVDGRKLIGSAQLRRGRAFLQHGSIPLLANREALAEALGGPVDDEAYTDLVTALGRDVRPQEVDRAVAEAFARRFGVELRHGELSDGERLRASQIRCWKHLSADWTINGRVGRREQRWAPAGPGLGGQVTPAR